MAAYVATRPSGRRRTSIVASSDGHVPQGVAPTLRREDRSFPNRTFLPISGAVKKVSASWNTTARWCGPAPRHEVRHEPVPETATFVAVPAKCEHSQRILGGGRGRRDGAVLDRFRANANTSRDHGPSTPTTTRSPFGATQKCRYRARSAADTSAENRHHVRCAQRARGRSQSLGSLVSDRSCRSSSRSSAARVLSHLESMAASSLCTAAMSRSSQSRSARASAASSRTRAAADRISAAWSRASAAAKSCSSCSDTRRRSPAFTSRDWSRASAADSLASSRSSAAESLSSAADSLASSRSSRSPRSASRASAKAAAASAMAASSSAGGPESVMICDARPRGPPLHRRHGEPGTARSRPPAGTASGLDGAPDPRGPAVGRQAPVLTKELGDIPATVVVPDEQTGA